MTSSSLKTYWGPAPKPPGFIAYGQTQDMEIRGQDLIPTPILTLAPGWRSSCVPALPYPPPGCSYFQFGSSIGKCLDFFGRMNNIILGLVFTLYKPKNAPKVVYHPNLPLARVR